MNPLYTQQDFIRQQHIMMNNIRQQQLANQQLQQQLQQQQTQKQKGKEANNGCGTTKTIGVARKILRIVIDLSNSGSTVSKKNVKIESGKKYNQEIEVGDGTLWNYKYGLYYYEIVKERRIQEQKRKKLPDIEKLYVSSKKLSFFAKHYEHVTGKKLKTVGHKKYAGDIKRKVMKIRKIKTFDHFNYKDYKYYGL